MRLKSLELQGFKSFPDKTLLKFDSGVTIIVGPNGSGKSNITDAMRWVLGELSSKNIRGSKMEDVIFAGASSRSQMSFAEVSVTFDNTYGEERLATPYDEVTVSRRYYRSGESSYLINRKQVRLRDIYELFMNTGIGREGYSIIGQGRIAEIISKKSEDRRNIFEEAAGIAKYRYKKHESEVKLGEVDANMLRAHDIHSELEARIDPLEKESGKARKYLELYEMKKRADVSLWLYETEKLRGEIIKTEKDCAVSAHELEMAQDSVATLESQNDRLFETSQQNKLSNEKITARIHDLITLRTALDEAHRKLTGEQSYRNATIENERSQLVRAETEIADAVKQRDEFYNTYETALIALKELESILESTVTEHNQKTQLKSENDISLENALKFQRERENTLTDLRVRISVIKNTLENDISRLESIASDIEKYEASSAVLKKEYDASSSTAADYAKMSASFKMSVSEYNDKLSVLNAERDALRREFSEKNSNAAALNERASALERLEEHFEGYVNSVRYIMQKFSSGTVSENGRIQGAIFGPVSRLIRVAQTYTVAIETALGANIQNIVVENEAVAKACIAVLKTSGAGRATFYPLSSVTGQNRTYELESCAKFNGFIGYANELIGYDAKYSAVISSLLSRTVIFDNLDNANIAARTLKFKVKIVTLDGQQINPGGSFTGGSTRRDSGMLTRGAEIEKLRLQSGDLKRMADETAQKIKIIDEKYIAYETKRASLNEQISITDELYLAQKADADTIGAKIDANDRLAAQIKNDRETLTQHRTKIGDDIAALEKESKAVADEISEIKKKRSSKDTYGYELSDKIDTLNTTINELNIKAAERRKDIEASKGMLDSCDIQIETLKTRIDGHKEKIVSLEAESGAAQLLINENRSEHRGYSDELEEREHDRSTNDSDAGDLDRRLNEARIKLRDVTARKENILLAHTKNVSKLQSEKDSLDKHITRLWDDYELTHAAALELDYPTVNEENRASVNNVLNDCKAKLKSLGSVNIASIDEYDEIRDRFEKLDVQIKDLEQSRAELQLIINELEEKMKSEFRQSFDKINEAFRVVFAELFGGGQGELILTDNDDILSCGIEIKAAPPGKVIKNMMLLSGGEQAFTAIALLFAILKVNPSPFCIFDEIEAALDEVNIARFANYIKRYSADTQFVVITHRRGTMEAADTLYGVTMPMQGISRVISVNPSDIGTKEKLIN